MYKALSAVIKAAALKLLMMSTVAFEAIVNPPDGVVLAVAWALSRTRRSATAREVCLMVGLLMLT